MLELVAKLNAGANERELFKEYRAGADKERAKRVLKMVRSLRKRGRSAPAPERSAPSVPMEEPNRGRSRSRGAGSVGNSAAIVRTVPVERANVRAR
jgi:hypothetical protein